MKKILTIPTLLRKQSGRKFETVRDYCSNANRIPIRVSQLEEWAQGLDQPAQNAGFLGSSCKGLRAVIAP